jgi:hypothetical protein
MNINSFLALLFVVTNYCVYRQLHYRKKKLLDILDFIITTSIEHKVFITKVVNCTQRVYLL